ncbi:hypothetical protein A5669_08475 [Mycolicibacterium fortuitum]|uniref:hypothetical protein n=1 Tax=Mycolicibacterium fortuitum TaxID=1766 RepID=UPI0007EA4F16|nr:hypothetical protein [Mycolicibacterium fortuitum]OBG45604.1 hypothetical protein A5669_08475 [Mycolicibacterium fortuitum]
MSATMKTRRTGLTIASAAIVFACGTLPTPHANAQPHGFPDLRQFGEVDAAQFSRPFSYPERWANVYSFFRTPDGLNCAIGPSSWCNGAIPGVPRSQSGSCASVHQDGDGQRFIFSTDYDPCESTQDKLLNPGQKLTDSLTGTTCVVGEHGLTACINAQHDHGFVLQPSGSWVF